MSGADQKNNNKDLRTAVELLRQMLVKQIELHDELLSCIHRKREAIRRADMPVMTDCCQREHRLTERLRDMDLRRPGIVMHLANLVGLKAPHANAISATDIANRLDEPLRGAIETLAAQLREKMQDVKREHSIVKQASEALSRHMAGIMQSVQALLNQSGTYERRGRIVTASPTMTGSVDVKS
jgi:hypothetical protein